MPLSVTSVYCLQLIKGIIPNDILKSFRWSEPACAAAVAHCMGKNDKQRLRATSFFFSRCVGIFFTELLTAQANANIPGTFRGRRPKATINITSLYLTPLQSLTILFCVTPQNITHYIKTVQSFHCQPTVQRQNQRRVSPQCLPSFHGSWICVDWFKIHYSANVHVNRGTCQPLLGLITVFNWTMEDYGAEA